MHMHGQERERERERERVMASTVTGSHQYGLSTRRFECKKIITYK